MTTKLEGGGGKALVVGPFFCRFPKLRLMVLKEILCCFVHLDYLDAAPLSSYISGKNAEFKES